MKNQFKPMLAAKWPKGMPFEEFLGHIKLPAIATPKVDGIRCFTNDTPDGANRSYPICRSLLPVPNNSIRRKIAFEAMPGLDGEIVTYSDPTLFNSALEARNFHEIQSDVMSSHGDPHFIFWLFDYLDLSRDHPHMIPYCKRWAELESLSLPPFCRILPRVYANTVKELMTFYEVMVERGWEGICWRHEHSLYKYGRSTLRQQGLVAHKKFVTSEAKILGYEEELKNLNAAERNELGYLKRSRKQENLVGKGRLGAFIMVTEDGATFKVGSGYSEAQRQVFWERR
jgi:DNA ligase-1